MNIVKERRDDASLLRIVVAREDCAQEVDRVLRDYRRKASVPGFRPGMVPMGIVKKMYGKGVLAEQSYRKASEAAYEYLQREGIECLGDLIPSGEQGGFDFEKDADFEFVFEYGEAPKIDLALSESDELTQLTIAVDDKMRAGYRSDFLRRYGRLVDVEETTSDEALSVTLDNGSVKVSDAYVGLASMSEQERAPFIGRKVGYRTSVNVDELYRNPAQRAAVLGVERSELEGLDPEFSLEITGIRRFVEPQLDEEFFKMAFPSGEVKSAAEFETFVEGRIAADLRRESEALFAVQMRGFLLKKASLKMPEGFLKRWLHTINEGRFAMEEIERDFARFVETFTWNYLRKHLVEREGIEVTEQDRLREAREVAAARLAQYGMGSVPDEMLGGYAERLLADGDQAQRIYERVCDARIVEAAKARIGVREKSVSAEEFARWAEEVGRAAE